MKNKIINMLFILVCGLLFIFILYDTKLVKEDILQSITYWLNSLIPSLYPSMIINELLLCSYLPYYINKYISFPFQKIFNISGNGVYVLLFSMICGTPTNVLIMKSMYDSKQLSKEECNKLLYYASFINPIFLYSMLTNMFSYKTVITLIVIEYLSNIIFGILIRSKKINIINNNYSKKLFNFTVIVRDSINNILMILGTIIIYSLISTFLCKFIGLNFIKYITIYLEITKGINNIHLLVSNEFIKILICSSLISFGGLCVLSQIKSIIADTCLNFNNYLIGRICSSVISLLLAIFVSHIY